MVFQAMQVQDNRLAVVLIWLQQRSVAEQTAPHAADAAFGTYVKDQPTGGLQWQIKAAHRPICQAG